MTEPVDFVASLMSSPGGVALLEMLEREHRDGPRRFDALASSEPAAVRRAVDAVNSMDVAELTCLALTSMDQIAGPWNPEALRQLPSAFRLAPARVSLAEAIDRRLASLLAASLAPDAQQLWLTDQGTARPERHLHHRNRTYCCGEFSWAGLWTISDPDDRLNDELVGAWEMYDMPLSRWRMPIAANARIVKIHCPEDWARLVTAYPARASGRHEGWELPGPNHHVSDVRPLVEESRGRAARLNAHVLMPDWERMAQDVDGVHLSWAGAITAEGCVVPVPGFGSDIVTMLRYWRSERTLRLNDVFGTPECLPPVAISDGYAAATHGLPMTPADREANDREVISTMLGRDPRS